VQVVEDVLTNKELFAELFDCYFSKDELVRLRVSNAMKRLAQADKSIVIPYLNRFINDVSAIDQPSAQWTLAQLFDILSQDLTENQKTAAKGIMKRNLANHSDWIVLKTSMDILHKWGNEYEELRNWLKPHLVRLSVERRKSVPNRAKNLYQSTLNLDY